MFYENTMKKTEIEENIKKYGWQYQYVFDENDKKENFSYSIGFEESFGHPEIMIFGLKSETMHAILSDIANDIRGGKVFEPNIKTQDVLSDDYAVLFKPVKEAFYPEYAGVAVRYYEQPFRLFVMFWPDKNNALPTEPNCELTVQNEALQIV